MYNLQKKNKISQNIQNNMDIIYHKKDDNNDEKDNDEKDNDDNNNDKDKYYGDDNDNNDDNDDVSCGHLLFAFHYTSCISIDNVIINKNKYLYYHNNVYISTYHVI